MCDELARIFGEEPELPDANERRRNKVTRITGWTVQVKLQPMCRVIVSLLAFGLTCMALVGGQDLTRRRWRGLQLFG